MYVQHGCGHLMYIQNAVHEALWTTQCVRIFSVPWLILMSPNPLAHAGLQLAIEMQPQYTLGNNQPWTMKTVPSLGSWPLGSPSFAQHMIHPVLPLVGCLKGHDLELRSTREARKSWSCEEGSYANHLPTVCLMIIGLMKWLVAWHGNSGSICSKYFIVISNGNTLCYYCFQMLFSKTTLDLKVTGNFRPWKLPLRANLAPTKRVSREWIKYFRNSWCNLMISFQFTLHTSLVYPRTSWDMMEPCGYP